MHIHCANVLNRHRHGDSKCSGRVHLGPKVNVIRHVANLKYSIVTFVQTTEQSQLLGDMVVRMFCPTDMKV